MNLQETTLAARFSFIGAAQVLAAILPARP
jgi:hypothetical protein